MRPASLRAGRLEAWLRPLIAQFCLASQILEQERALGAGLYHVTRQRHLIAAVDLRGDAAVLPTAAPLDFENAMWTAPVARTARRSISCGQPVAADVAVRPAHGARCAAERYRTDCCTSAGRRDCAQRLLRDSHLLLLRELAMAPAPSPSCSSEPAWWACNWRTTWPRCTWWARSPPTRSAPRRPACAARRAGTRRCTATSPASRPGGSRDSRLPPRANDLTAPAPLSLE